MSKSLKPFKKLKGPLTALFFSKFEDGKTINNRVEYPNGCMLGVVPRNGLAQPAVVKSENNSVDIITKLHPHRCPYCESSQCLQNKWGDQNFEYEYKNKIHELYVYICQNTNRYYLKEEFWIFKLGKKFRCVICASPKVEIIEKYVLNLKNGHKGELTNYFGESINEEHAKSVDVIEYDCKNCKHWNVVSLAKDEQGNLFVFDLYLGEGPDMYMAISLLEKDYHVKKVV